MEEKFLEVIENFKKKTEKECYKISVVEGEPTILEDKIGGLPYLPVGVDYPKDKSGNPMPLLLQINLKNVELKGYPKKGILEIFTDKEVEWPCQYVVKYFEEGLEYQTEFPNIDTSRYIVGKPLKISLEKNICHMTLNDYRLVDIMCSIVNEMFNTSITNYTQLDDFFGDFLWEDEILDNITSHSANIGGYPDFTQNDPRKSDLSNKDECLFKLDSMIGNGIEIGDSGILFALISQEDIKNCNFENAVVDWDCW